MNALGIEGLNCYLCAIDEEQKPGANRETLEDAYRTTLNALERMFNPHQDLACVCTQFKYLRQRPDETTVEFTLEVQWQVKLCEFGVASEPLAFDQIVTGISSPQLKPDITVGFPSKGCFLCMQALLANGGMSSTSNQRHSSVLEGEYIQ